MATYVFLCLFLIVAVQAAEISERECNPGDRERQDCNRCFCMTNGKWACTKIKCLRKREANRDDEPMMAECRDGDTTSFDNGCNNCNCYGGIWACTLKLCPELEAVSYDQLSSGIEKFRKREVGRREEPCKNGDVTSFDNGCNTCTCQNGLWACTLKFCL